VKIVKGSPIKVEPHPIIYARSMDRSMKDAIDALVELITNADDSYGRLYRKAKRKSDGGKIVVTRIEKRGDPSILVVQDRAEGMTLARMVEVLQRPGSATASSGDRGCMGRGAKDCSKFGDMVFESIVDDRYYRCRLTRHAGQIIPETHTKGQTADDKMRQRLGIRRRENGTVVTLLLLGAPLRRADRLQQQLASHFALRDIVAKNAPGELLVIDENSGKTLEVTYYLPEGEHICVGEPYDVPGYPHADARLTIYRVEQPFDEADSTRFRQDGLVIKGMRAIHECSMLIPELERQPHRLRYFGRIESAEIDRLVAQWREYYDRGRLSELPSENPCFLLDQERQYGLSRDHPFTQMLIQYPSERLRALISRDKERDRRERREIGNEETQKRLNRLARFASRFMTEKLDEAEETVNGDWVDRNGWAKKGVMIVPSGGTVAVGEEKQFYVYAKRSLVNKPHPSFVVLPQGPEIETLGRQPFVFVPDERREERLRGGFRIRGKEATPASGVKVACADLEPIDVPLEVLENTMEDRDFVAPLEFERREYRVRAGGRRLLRLFAKYPDVVCEQARVKVHSEDQGKVAIIGQCVVAPVSGTNYAEGSIRVEGRTLRSKAAIAAELNGRRAEALVRVVQKPEDPRIAIDIKLVDEALGPTRSKWRDDLGKPNLLHINGLHESLRRYLGKPEGAPAVFPGENSPLYFVLLAEIVAEAVCHKSMLEEAKQNSAEFDDLMLAADPREILDTSRAMYTRRFKEFIVRAHAEMVKQTEAVQFIPDND